MARIAGAPRAAATPETGPDTGPASATASPRALGGDGSVLSGLAGAMAEQPPVNSDRVAQIKKAIADGHFPILPATIADQMIALKLNWNGK
ncbi:flagellar biosynthesis anti-sigma factor FlgM [uncultured Sphingomonas sp.]|uniref:flagellar biosynthesis anti-sigma factor FlgM n=1 Tax=uncultured Sphingomonas sp. TaxID=158754 RepID=UPI0025CB84CA|nr:flagellar biosynthesis anti-sigma factor FlgM [uncultured Sphingomonas sp.]